LSLRQPNEDGRDLPQQRRGPHVVVHREVPGGLIGHLILLGAVRACAKWKAESRLAGTTHDNFHQMKHCCIVFNLVMIAIFLTRKFFHPK
jgi:hypothetical protein